MLPLRDKAYLQGILEAAKLAISYVQGIEKRAFLENIQLQDAGVR